MEYLTLQDLSKRWKVSDSTLRRWMRNGELKVVRIGRGIRVDVSEAERFESALQNREQRQ